ncbi:MAG TPA: AarF/ABC1/UbiB kinase family protein [Chloroflexi bacterium]|nr:AarF/ABC1/UbiB kinase family protein [Chloroflexota bacterium]
MYQPFQRVRHLGRYREIAQVLIKHGFGDLVNRLGLPERLSLPRRGMQEKPSPLDTSTRIRLALEELGPTFVKLGQVLSTRPDLLPPSFIAELRKLQDEVPPVPWDEIRAQIERELDGPLESVFAEVEEKPLAAASLAQVHAARLLDGSEVVIKIQRPGIRSVIEIDLEIMFDLANLLQAHTPLGELYDLPAIAEEFAYTLQTELDYRHEARHAERFRRNFAGEPSLHIPRIYWDTLTRRMLVMERLHGVKIDDREALIAAGYDPHRVALKAVRIIIKEVLEDGFFHADPHPGNFVVMEGEVIGAMDFGMVGWLEPRQRIELAQLYIAAVRLDVDRVVDYLVQLGVTPYTVDRAGLHRDISRLLRKYQGIPVKDIRFQEVMDEVMTIAFRYHLHLPADLWLLSKTLVMMEGVAHRLDPDFDIFAVSEPHVRRLAWELLLPRTWGPELLKTAGAWATLLGAAPESSLAILRRLEKGELEVVLRHRGLEQALVQLDRITDRLVVSILVAALIVGIALLIPALSLNERGGWVLVMFVIAFAAASFLGFWLLLSILRAGIGRGPRS